MKRLPCGDALSSLIIGSRNGLKVAIDCSLQEHMSDKVYLFSKSFVLKATQLAFQEIMMAAQQTQYAFAANLRSPAPLSLHITGLLQGTRLHRVLHDSWRGFSNPAVSARRHVPISCPLYEAQQICFPVLDGYKRAAAPRNISSTRHYLPIP